MINLSKLEEYFVAIKKGFDCYGLNGFYQIHKDITENLEEKWEESLRCLNDLSYEEFETLCKIYTMNKWKK